MNKRNSEKFKGIEYINCSLCAADDFQVKYHVQVRDDQIGSFGRDEWEIVQCNRCDLVYVNPRPDAQALAAYYKLENPTDYQTIQDRFIITADLQRPLWRRYLRAMQRFGEPGGLLDVGCGAGTFMLEARGAGYQVAGQEVTHFFVDYCRNKLKLTTYEGELESLPLESGTLDWVTAFDVIEHHPNPRHMVQEMHLLVRPGGLIVISTHDIGNRFARWYGSQWRYINPIGHLTYFTRETLTEMLIQNGFRVLHTGGIHTIDKSTLAELGNWMVQFGRAILLRSLIIGLYMPVSRRVPSLTRWKLKIGQGTWDHHKLQVRTGRQILMNDDIVFIARRST